jgi:HEAT repeat protein
MHSDDRTRAVYAGEAEVAALSTSALVKTYERLRKHKDFNSFNERMDVLRVLGREQTPAAQAALLRIVETSKRLDDEIVAMLAMGKALDLPQALALVRFLHRRGGPVRVRTLGRSLASATDPALLAWLAGNGLLSPNEGSLRAVLDAQFAHADPRALQRLQEIYEQEQERRTGVHLAYAAARAIGSIGARHGDESREVRRFLIRAAKSPDFRLRLAVAEATAKQQELDLNMRGLLRTLLADEKSAAVRQAAARGIGDAGLQEFVPELAERLEDERIKTRDVAYEALVKISDRDLGYDASHWKAWFENRSESETPQKTTPYAAESSYFGVRVHSDRVLFIVDLSGSMAYPWGQETTRLDVARSELQAALQHLPSGTLFNIIAFSDSVKSWQRKESAATPKSVKSALKWMARVFKEPRGGTFMYAALEKAFTENPQVDTIFLLSDGLATDGEPIVPDAIYESVNEWNRYRRVTIHTFALTLEDLPQKGLPPDAFDDVKAFMQRLAAETGGTSHVIKDVPTSKAATKPRSAPKKGKAPPK